MPLPITFSGRIFKRILDLVGSVLLLILLLPLLAALVLVIKCHDGGPVFFRRRVVGPRGELGPDLRHDI